MEHTLKIDQEHFNNLISKRVTYQIRDDNRRDFKVDDVLVFNETKFTGEEMENGYPLSYTGNTCTCLIREIIKNMYGLKRDYVILHVELKSTSLKEN